MTTLERRLADALRAGAEQIEPAPDLFDRVTDSIERDRRQRRTTAVTVTGVAGGFAVATLLFLALAETSNGRFVMPWWVLELVTTLVLVGMALWLGPFIKRFGRAYAADVFRANPQTGKSYIVLTDIVYYLIFLAYIMFTSRFQPADGWEETVSAAQAETSVFRVAGILLVIGILHGLNIVLMPVLGRLFSLNRRLDSLDRNEGVDD